MAVTKTTLVEMIAQELGCTKKMASDFLNLFIDLITQSLKKGEDVKLPGFGTFRVSHRAARKGVNPQTGAEIQIKASNVPAFKSGKALKTAVNS